MLNLTPSLGVFLELLAESILSSMVRGRAILVYQCFSRLTNRLRLGLWRVPLSETRLTRELWGEGATVMQSVFVFSLFVLW